jgi:N-acyl-D-aspartate/D-glutamate deacylase
MAKTLIAGGLVVDGSGGEPLTGDVVIDGGRILAVGRDLPRGDVDRVIDASDRIVAPGFIDIHSHYDAQVFWDPMLSSSCHHGVTSVINGNCGFSLAPYAEEHRPIVLRMLRDLEDMYTDTLEAAVPAAVESFEDYLAAVETARPMLNFGCFIGHSTMRIATMGEAAYERPASAEELAAMKGLIDRAMAAGAMGFATKTIVGSRPSPSQFASGDETLALLKTFGAHGRGVAMFNAGGAFDLDRVYETQQEVGRPFTWIAMLAMRNGLHNEKLEMHRRWRERGAEVRPQVSCRPLSTQCRMSMPAVLRAPIMTELNAKSDAERLAAYASAQWRDQAREVVGTLTGPIDWRDVNVLESASTPQSVGRDIASLAQERGAHPFDVLMDIAVADKLATLIMIANGNSDSAEVIKLLNAEGAVLGLSDAGAHPLQTCDAVMATDLLGNWVRGKGAMSLEAAVHKLSQEPALLMGLADRGLLAPGYFADIVVFDPKTIAPGPLRTVADLPMGRERLLAAQPTGVHHILINGRLVREDETTRYVPSGRMLRPN